MNARDLYAQAYHLHYNLGDFQGALQLYEQIQWQFGGTAEAGYSATQAATIRGASGPGGLSKSQYGPANYPVTGGALAPGNEPLKVSGKFAFWFVLVATPIICLVIYLKASSNNSGDGSSDAFRTERAAFDSWRAIHYPGGKIDSGDYQSAGCKLGAATKAEGNSGGFGMSVEVALNITSGGEPMSGQAIFVPDGPGWRCDRGTVRPSIGKSIAACPPLSFWCKDQ